MTRLTNAILLSNTYVLFGAAFSVVALGEGMGPRVAGALLTALAGAGCILRPDLGRVQLGDLLALMGLLGAVGQPLMTYAYGWCTTAEGGILSLRVVPLSSALGVIFLGEHLGAWDWAGAAIILASSIYVMAGRG